METHKLERLTKVLKLHPGATGNQHWLEIYVCVQYMYVIDHYGYLPDLNIYSANEPNTETMMINIFIDLEKYDFYFPLYTFLPVLTLKVMY